MELTLYAPCPTLRRHDISLFKNFIFVPAAYSKMRLNKDQLDFLFCNLTTGAKIKKCNYKKKKK